VARNRFWEQCLYLLENESEGIGCNITVSSWKVFIIGQILIVWTNKEGCDGQGMGDVRKVENFRLNRKWKRPLERWKCRSGTNAKIDHKEVGCDIVNGFDCEQFACCREHGSYKPWRLAVWTSCFYCHSQLINLMTSHSPINSNIESVLQRMESQKQLPLCYSVMYVDYKGCGTLTLYFCFLSVRSRVIISAWLRFLFS